MNIEEKNLMREKLNETFNRPHYAVIPESMRQPMIDFVVDHRPTGSFLRSILCNDLKGAFETADPENAQIIRTYILWFYNCTFIHLGASNYNNHIQSKDS